MAKAIVQCALLGIEEVGRTVYRAHLQRTSTHPVLGADKKGSVTITSQILRIDFENHLIETLNTIYRWED